MNRAYALGAVALTAVVLIFALQNLHFTAIRFILWEVNASVSLVALAAFLGGLCVGWLSGLFRGRRKSKEAVRKTPPALSPGDPTAATPAGVGTPQKDPADPSAPR